MADPAISGENRAFSGEIVDGDGRSFATVKFDQPFNGQSHGYFPGEGGLLMAHFRVGSRVSGMIGEPAVKPIVARAFLGAAL